MRITRRQSVVSRRASTPLLGVGAVSLSMAALAAACGSSSNGNAPGAQNDAAAPESDSSTTPTDAATGKAPEAAPPAADGGAGDSGILGANCPPFDAGPGPFAEAKHGPLPTMKYFGGGIVQVPQVITFTFPTTPGVATLEAFGKTVTQSPWFAAVAKDFCVDNGATCITPGATGLSVEMTATAAATYTDTMGGPPATSGVDLDSFINDQIAAAVTAGTIPAPGPNAIYAFYFPSSSTISMGGGASSCQGFGGYHSSITYKDGKTPIVYAIMPDCPSGNAAADLQGVTIAASHEIIEAATDPYPFGSGSWYLDQDQGSPDGGFLAPTVPQIHNDPWAAAVSFGEVGDNCESIPLQEWTLDSGVLVQRIWSPSAALLGHNPCVPVPAGESYYNASPDKVLYVADVGTTFTVDVSAFSDMPRADWRLDADDSTPTQMTDPNNANNPLPYLKLEYVGGVTRSNGGSALLCVNNGTTGQLKVTLLADPDTDTSLVNGLSWPEADGLIVARDVSNPITGAGGTTLPYQFWPFAVVTTKTAATLGITSSGVADARKLAALRAAHPPAHRNYAPLPRRLPARFE